MVEKQVETIQLPQMTLKACGCDAKEAIRQKAQVYLARIFGEAAAAKTKESRSGDMYTYLIGTFRAVTPDLKTFESEKLFLPSGIQEKVEAELSASDGKPVQFGYDFWSTPDDKVTVGYRYAAKSILATQATDRLAVMAGEVAKVPTPGETEKVGKAKK